MKYINKKMILGCIVALMGLNSLLAQTVVDEIVAKVDNHIILKSDVEQGYQQLLASGKYPPNAYEAKCEILKQLLMNKVIYAKAQIDSVEVDEKRVEQELDRRMNYFILQAGSQQKLEETLGTSVADLRSDLKDQVQEQMTVQQMQQTILGEVKITPAQVEEYFGSIPEDSIPFLAAEMKVGQIVMEPEVSKSEKDKVKDQLLAIKKRIEGGEDFATLAKQYSEDYGSARKGGDLGWHGRGELVPEFEETALTIEEGQISDPVESDFGYHMIELLERRGNRFRARHILMRPKSNSDDLTRALHKMDSVRNLILLDSTSFAKAAQDFSTDQMTRSNAGFFKNPTTGSSFVASDELDPVIFFTVDTMKVGNITESMKYRTEDGKDAVRIIFYDGYKKPHYANLKDDYQKLHQATLNSKKNEILQNWIRKAKSDVFIDIDEEYKECAFLDEFK